MENCIAVGIRAIIADKGLVQKAVAQRAGFTEQQFSDMLNKRKIIRVEYIPAIAKALGVSVGELYAAGAADGTA